MDYIVRGTDKDRNFRFFAANTTELVNTATQKHVTTPVASAALGRTMTAAVMMGAMLKNESDRVAISIRGDGPIQGITAEADASGNVKGYVHNPNVDIPNKPNGKLDVSGAIGNAVMTVMKDIGLKEPYEGSIAMLSGEIAEDITDYFAISEQTNSLVILGVLIDRDYSIKQAGGVIVQVLPNATDEAISAVEERLKGFTSLTALMEEGKTVEEVTAMILGEDMEIMDRMDAQFKCDCSTERMERALISVGKKDLEEIIEDEDENVELVCHFCSEKYNFGKDDLRELVKSL